jgi:hypothetical protein
VPKIAGLSLRTFAANLYLAIAVAILPVVFLYGNNANRMYIQEALPILGAFAAAGCIIYLVLLPIMRSCAKAAGTAILLVVLLSYYKYLEIAIKHVVNLKFWHILPIALFVFLHVGYLIYKKAPDAFLKILNRAAGIVITVLLVFNLALSVPYWSGNAGASGRPVLQGETAENDALPNLYWLLFDEYSNFNVIEKYYDYDNGPFAEFLTKSGFHVSYNSFNETYVTTTVLTNYVNLDYVANDGMTNLQKNPIRYNGRLFELLRTGGYQIVPLGDSMMFNMEPVLDAGKSGATTIGGETFSDLILRNTAVYPLMSNQSANLAVIHVKNYFDYFLGSAIYGSKSKFLLGYLCFPHQPFMLDANGRDVPGSHSNDWNDKKYYLGQYIYATKRIRETIQAILKNDPDCVIVLQSDHSVRFVENVDGDIVITNQDKKNFLNAVYYRGEPLAECDGLSGVNTWRFVINRLLGTDLPVLEVPDQ